MAKGNDKKVVKQARELLLGTIGNLLESHRERRFAYSQRAKPLPRRLFCRRQILIRPSCRLSRPADFFL